MSINSSNYNRRTYKIVLLGDSGVGKTCIIERFSNNRYDPKDDPTVGIDFIGKNIFHNNKTYRLQIWDTAGQQRYRSLIPSYLKDALCAIFVYDVSDNQSLYNLENWIKLYLEHRGDKSLLILCGNKSDLNESIETTKLSELQKRYNMKQFKVSALSGENIEHVFRQIIEHIAQEKDRKKTKKMDSIEHLPPPSCENLAKFEQELNFTEKDQSQLIKSKIPVQIKNKKKKSCLC